MSAGALEGLVVLDLSRVLSGPYCGAIMGDMGADVIKIEVPGIGDDTRRFNAFINGESNYYMNFNRSKRGITLNLKSAEGKELFLRLVEKADVIIENFRPGTMERMGIGYETLKKVNPGIVLASISGYGLTGPYSQEPAYDMTVQALSGIMSVTGYPDEAPVRAGAAFFDAMGGASAVIGILAALRYRDKTGRGQVVDVAMLDAAVSSMTNVIQHYTATGIVPGRTGNEYGSACPCEDYAAMDGSVAIAAGNDSLWKRMCGVMGREDLLEVPAYATNYDRVQNRKALRVEIEKWLADKTVAEATDLLKKAGVPVAPINNIAQVVEDPQLRHRKMFVEIDHPVAGKVLLTGPHIKMSETDPVITRVPPRLGEHTDEVLQQFLGLSPEEITALREKKAI